MFIAELTSYGQTVVSSQVIIDGIILLYDYIDDISSVSSISSYTQNLDEEACGNINKTIGNVRIYDASSSEYQAKTILFYIKDGNDKKIIAGYSQPTALIQKSGTPLTLFMSFDFSAFTHGFLFSSIQAGYGNASHNTDGIVHIENPDITTDDAFSVYSKLQTDALFEEAIEDATNDSHELIMGTQTASVAAWTGVTKRSALYVGMTINYFLPYAGKANSTLNLTLADGTLSGAIPIYFRGATAVGTHFPVGSLIQLTYLENITIGSTTINAGWFAMSNYVDGNTTTYLSAAQPLKAGTNGIFGRSLVMRTGSDTWESIVLSYKSALAQHVLNTQSGFYTDTIFYNAGTTTVTSGNSSTATMYPVYNTITYTNYFLDTVTTPFVVGKPIYFVGTIHSDGKFYFNSPVYHAQEITTSDIYVFIGLAYSSTTLFLLPYHPMFTLKNGKIVEVTTHSLAIESEIPTNVSDLNNDAGYITTETDPTVPSWAKQQNKPTYTAQEVGALPDTTQIPSNTSDLTNDSGFITSSDIPTNVSSFTNDAGYLTSYTETDPTVPSWAKQTNKPSYTLDEVTDGTTRKLSNYELKSNLKEGAYVDVDETTMTSSSTNLPTAKAVASYISSLNYITSASLPTKTSDLTNDSGYITSSDIPSNVSAFTNDAGYLTQHQDIKTINNNSLIGTGNVQLDLGDHNVIESISVNNTSQTITNKNVNITVPTNTNQLTNGAGFITSSDIPSNVSAFTNDAGYLTSFTETDPTVPSWAKASTKPTYTASEVGALPDDTFIPSNTTDLTNDAEFITASDIPSNVSAFTNDAGYLTSYTETDPTVPSWAKQTNKPSYTLDEVSDGTTRKLSNYVPTTRKVNNKALSADITLNLDDVADGSTRKLSNYIPYSEILSTINGFDNRRLWQYEIHNTLWAANKRYDVTLTGFNNNNASASLFDGSFETNVVVPKEGTGIILISGRNGSKMWGGGYPYGYLEVAFYYTNIPESVTCRVYSDWEQNPGWHNVTLTNVDKNNNQALYRGVNTGFYGVTQVEITINAKDSVTANVTEVAFYQTRGTLQQMAVFNKTVAQTLYHDLTGTKFIVSGGTQSQFLKADGSLDSNTYATSSQIPTKTSDLTNDSGYITSSALSGYAQTSSLKEGAYVDVDETTMTSSSDNLPTSKAVASYISSLNYATTSQIPTVNNAKLTIQRNGAQIAEFTANASSPVTANIEVPILGIKQNTTTLTPDANKIVTVTVPTTVSELSDSENYELKSNLKEGAYVDVDETTMTSSSDNLPTSKAVASYISGQGFLTQHQSLDGQVASAQYNSTDKTIEFYNASGTKLNTDIDATDFIKDGMVDTVEVTGGNLVITFNTDAGKEDIEIPITDIFDADDYYTKDDIDGFGFLTAHQSLDNCVQKVASTDNAITRFDGTGGAIQNSGVLIDDSNNLLLPLGSSSTFANNAKLAIGNAWFGSNTTGGLAYGTKSGSTYTSYYTFETTAFRPVSGRDNTIDIGTSQYRWKRLYIGTAISNGTYTYSLPGATGTLALTSQIPSNVSALTNDSGYLTSSDLSEGAFVDVDETTTTSTSDNLTTGKAVASYISSLNLATQSQIPTVNNAILTIKKNNDDTGTTFTANAATDVTANLGLHAVASSGSYNDLSNKPTIPTVNNSTITIKKNTDDTGDSFTTNAASGKTINLGLHDVATSGDYDDLTNKPDINNATLTIKKNSSDTGTTFTANASQDVTANLGLHAVATSGSYNDLTNKPTIPTVNNATLTIQKNGTTVNTFSANASSPVTANITVPTTVVELSDSSDYVTQTELTEAISTPIIQAGNNISVSYSSSLIPSGYTQVEYITSTGSSYINTNIPPTDTTKVIIEAYTTSTGSFYLFGARATSSSTILFGQSGSATGAVISASVNGTSLQASTNGVAWTRSSTGQRYTIGIETNNGTFTYCVKDHTNSRYFEGTSNYTLLGTQTTKIMLCAFNSSNILTGTTRIYQFEIYQNDTLAFKGIPCIRQSDGKYGLYDTVSESFFASVSSTSFSGSDRFVGTVEISSIDNKAVWGNITGTLSNQTDLNNALGLKANSADLATVATSGDYTDLTNKPTNVSAFTNDAGYLTSFTETDPTVPSWAKASSKPTYTLDEVTDGTTRKLSNYVPTTRTVNSKALSSNITLTLDDVADGTNRSIPTNTNQLTNGAGFITSSDLPTNHVTTDTAQEITGAKTIAEDKLKIGNTSTNEDIDDYVFKRGQEFIVGTQTSSTSLWKGVTKQPALYEGMCVNYFVPVASTSTTASLELTFPDNTTSGAIPVIRNAGSTVTSSHIGVGAVVQLTLLLNRTIGSTSYEKVWKMNEWYDSNTNTIGYQIRTHNTTMPVSSAAGRYRLLFTSADGTKYVPANASTSTSATATKTVTQTPIDPFGRIAYYASTTILSENGTPGTTTLYDQYNLTIGYSFTPITLTANTPVYIKCAPQANGSAIINSTSPMVQSLPSTNDGNIYIFLGIATSTTAIEMFEKHPIYYHDGTCIRIWIGSVIPTNTNQLTNGAGFITSSDLPTNHVTTDTVQTISATKTISTSSNYATELNGTHVKVYMPTPTYTSNTGTKISNMSINVGSDYATIENSIGRSSNGDSSFLTLKVKNHSGNDFSYIDLTKNAINYYICNSASEQVVKFSCGSSSFVHNTDVRPYVDSTSSSTGFDLGTSSYKWKYLYISSGIKNGTYTYSLPSATGTLALTSQIPSVPLESISVDGTTQTITNKNVDLHIPDDIYSADFICSMTRTNVSGSGNLTLSGISGPFPVSGTPMPAGTYIVRTRMQSTTASYSLTVTFGASYTLTTTNGVIDDTRTITLSSASTYSASVTQVNANTFIKVSMFEPDVVVETVGSAAVTNDYNDLDNIPTIGNGTLTIQKNGSNVATFNANNISNVTANITVPTKVSDLTNDSGFITSSDLPTNHVTTDTAQTISGNKTFTGTLTGTLNGHATSATSLKYSSTNVLSATDTTQITSYGDIIPSSSITYNLGSPDSIWTSIYLRDMVSYGDKSNYPNHYVRFYADSGTSIGSYKVSSITNYTINNNQAVFYLITAVNTDSSYNLTSAITTPKSTNVWSLGTSSLALKEIYISGSDSNYKAVLGNSGDSSYTHPTIRPTTDETGFLGLPDSRWRGLYCDVIGSSSSKVQSAYITNMYGEASSVTMKSTNSSNTYPLVFSNSLGTAAGTARSLYTGDTNALSYDPSKQALYGVFIIPQGTASYDSSTYQWTVSSITPIDPTKSSNPPTGAVVCVYFNAVNSSTSSTLKFGNWNAKSIYRVGSTHVGTTADLSWPANSYVLLRYSGSYWYILNYNNNPTSTASGTTNIIPSSDNIYDLGSSSYRWNNLYAYYVGDSSTKIQYGYFNYCSISTLRNGSNSNLATLTSAGIIPTTDSTSDSTGFDLGDSTHKWKSFYISGGNSNNHYIAIDNTGGEPTIRPETSNYGYLGTSSYKWYRGYINSVFLKYDINIYLIRINAQSTNSSYYQVINRGEDLSVSGTSYYTVNSVKILRMYNSGSTIYGVDPTSGYKDTTSQTTPSNLTGTIRLLTQVYINSTSAANYIALAIIS